MQSFGVVVPPPFPRCTSRGFERQEPGCVQELLSDGPVERFAVSVVGWLPRSREVDLDIVPVRPSIDGDGCELATVIAADGSRLTTPPDRSVQDLDNISRRQAVIRVKGDAFSREDVHDGEATRPDRIVVVSQRAEPLAW